MLSPSLAPMGAYQQWIVWKEIPHEPKNRKVPWNIHTNHEMNAQDETKWMDYNQAYDLTQKHDLNLGFVFTANDPFFFLDIDGCAGSLAEDSRVTEACNLFAGCAAEVSHSGDGMHMFGTGTVPTERCCRNIKQHLEFYTEQRFCAITDNGSVGNALFDATAALSTYVPHYFPKSSDAIQSLEEYQSPCEEWSGPADDSELLTKMMSGSSAKATFFGGASFKDLFTANVDALAGAYPPEKGGEWNQSSSDLAILCHLAWWTGKDAPRMLRLFYMSALVREKSRNRGKYMDDTMKRAIGGCDGAYNDGRKTLDSVQQAIDATPVTTVAPANPVDDTVVQMRAQVREQTDVAYCMPEDQITMFQNCVYVASSHKIFNAKDMDLKPDTFNALYGGYEFVITPEGDKTTRKAFEAFTQSMVIKFPKADTTCFRPELPQRALVQENGLTMVNIYTPPTVPMAEGDVTLFLNHMKLLIPNERDRQILLAWFASCVQNHGKKVRYAPVIQGIPGNGKTFLAECIEYAVGYQYTHKPNAQDLGNTFNAWIRNKVLIVVEEIFTRDKLEVMETLKPLITNSRIEVHGKGENQVTGDNRANFLMFTNYPDGIRKTKVDRRYAIFYTNQQELEDIHRDFPAGYFKTLFGWAENGGYANVAHYLKHYEIPPEFDPTLLERAPDTTSTTEALIQGLGPVEQEIMEAVEEGRRGFRGGWISSSAINALTDEKKMRKVAPKRIPDMMKALGYILHPGLTRGRATKVTLVDGVQPRLYIHENAEQKSMVDPHEITADYEVNNTGV